MIALRAERPYRFGLSVRSTLQIMDSMVRQPKLGGDLVGIVVRNIEELNAIRESAQSEAFEQHKKFVADLQEQGGPAGT